MKNKSIILFSAIILIFFTFNSCKKSYITGDIQNVNQYSKLTSYQYLQSNPVFDTLVKCIDAAGFKDAVNANGTTFFAPTNFVIYNYLYLRTSVVQNIDQNEKWGLDSLLYYLSNNIHGTKDSLKMYLFNQKLTYDVLTSTGKFYKSGLVNDSAIISYEETKDIYGGGYNSNYSSPIKLVYFAHLYKPYPLSDANPSSAIPPDVGVRYLCPTTGINTSNGVIHVLPASHSLFYSRYQ